ncbi:MAG: META domain-containing protein [Ignavibacteria bacterium]
MKTLYAVLVIAVIFSALSFNGCSGSKEQVSITPLVGTEWRLETLNGKSIALKSGNYITLNFSAAADKINGAGVCNKYFGEFTKNGSAMKFSGIGSTKMMCDDNLNESDYFSSLGVVDAYKIAGGKLTLLSKGITVAIYK